MHLVVPGRLDQRTGGYLYDARMADGLRALGWHIVVHSLGGRFPGPDPEAEQALSRLLAALPDRARVLIDGLALGGLPDPLAAHASRLQPIALVHHPLRDETGLSAARAAALEALERRALAHCRGVIVTSPHTARRLRDWIPDRIGIRCVLPGTATAITAAAPDPAAPPRILCVGAVTPRKGQDLLVRALATLRSIPWHCVIAGSLARHPNHVRQVREQIRTAGIADRVQLAGECTSARLNHLYRSSQLFALPSWHEGYGMAFAEAMAHGLPVIGTRAGAIPDTVPRQAGILVAPGDIEALIQALARLLQDPAARARLGQAGRHHARTLADWPAAAQQLASAVLELTRP
ncbi:glycosyl transferase [Thioalkalivibrio paradoxus ARh 1]|uniref:Glycosyl transferase n=1 Tax=Thioalkalivibrio paradoxus ARh 1 TaxID=713585 RepID=W0DMX1_9GAMM|nr:glycosyl transferase [Thioalkalivibrio paradoxus ARh 1]